MKMQNINYYLLLNNTRIYFYVVGCLRIHARNKIQQFHFPTILLQTIMLMSTNLPEEYSYKHTLGHKSTQNNSHSNTETTHTEGSLPLRKFYPHRCNVLPLSGQKPYNRPVSGLHDIPTVCKK